MTNSFYEIKRIADTVRNTDLNLVLTRLGALKDKYDKAKWHTSQGVVSVSGQKFMNWSRNVGGGGAIDLIMHLQDMQFIDAVNWLSNHFFTPLTAFNRTGETKAELKRVLQLPHKDDSRLTRVISYLTQQRHIPQYLINHLLKSGKLYADTKSNAVFLLLGKKKSIVGAELRGTGHLPWRGMASGSNKNLGCFYVNHRRTNKIILCESAIDAISCLFLYPDCMAISTSGANPNPAWLKSLLNHQYHIFCGFDSDHAGDNMADNLISLYPSLKRLRPSLHDWNDVLVHTLTKS